MLPSSPLNRRKSMLAAVRRNIRRFTIRKSVVGVPFHAYRDGYLETSDLRLIAMLRRLPDTTAEELSEDAEFPEPKGMAAKPDPIEEMSYWNLVELGKEAGVFKQGMKKSALIAALTRQRLG